MDEAERLASVDEVVGRNLRRLREEKGLTQDQVASFLRFWGMRWTRGMVANTERGRRTLDLGEIAAWCSALDCSVFDLLAGNEEVVVGKDLPRVRGPRLIPSTPRLRNLLQGRPWSTPLDPEDQLKETPERAARGDTEIWAARRLGIDPLSVSKLAFQLWGHSLTAERDRRERGDDDAPVSPTAASLAARRARRGHISRALIAELRTELEKPKRRPRSRRQ